MSTLQLGLEREGPVVVVVLAGKAGGGQAWLRPTQTQVAGRIEMDFANENLLTMDGLREVAGLPRARHDQ